MRTGGPIIGRLLALRIVKATASGNPAVLTLAEADAELQRLNILHKNHADEQYIAPRSLRELPTKIEQMKKRLSDLAADQATAKARARPRLDRHRQGTLPR